MIVPPLTENAAPSPDLGEEITHFSDEEIPTSPTAEQTAAPEESADWRERLFQGLEDEGQREALNLLLQDPPKASDLELLAALERLYPRSTENCNDEALRLIANRLVRFLGKPERRALTCRRAWQMLDKRQMEQAIADHLRRVVETVTEWQRTHSLFFELGSAEVDVVEGFFEALPPARHRDLLADVMNLKVLSNRRMGLLRRLAMHARQQIPRDIERDRPGLLTYLQACIDLFSQIIDRGGYKPIIEQASQLREQLTAIHERILNPPPPAPPGKALFRIG